LNIYAVKAIELVNRTETNQPMIAKTTYYKDLILVAFMCIS